ncbi:MULTISPECIES: DUF2933 domain-containing protein [Bacillati]|uniref:DUF2933 domain-containing protein n=2 Tax=Bacillati TaxID=1783272 RepID=A0A3S2U857_9BACI|nr:DUF2933 domain-containing protein [Niallia taxi]MDK8642999.1 DUF2933 domain-containing protein [Niallia taxi]MED4038249.1 DUF2933 domain-containing protein [Niallia taxi]MED4055142.1 DUF2933 domain-containing protein [Niallia taxi]MED4120668.1 DUF2933 domain-containing protein [Niallia taxi]RVT59408.1 DUF2933 domain-containing protein [Niallia taxi]
MTLVQILILLLCPLMMLFCMKGMFSGNKDKIKNSDHQQVSQTELQSLHIKMADLIEQNHNLTKEIHSLKEQKNHTP